MSLSIVFSGNNNILLVYFNAGWNIFKSSCGQVVGLRLRNKY